MIDFLAKLRGIMRKKKEEVKTEVKTETKEEIMARAEKIIRELEEGDIPFNLAYHATSPFLLGYNKERKVFTTRSRHEVENHDNLSREEAINSVAGSLELGGY